MDDGEGMILYQNQRRFGGGLADGRYNVAHNPVGMEPNVPLTSDLGKEPQPPILSIPDMYRGQVNIYIHMYIHNTCVYEHLCLFIWEEICPEAIMCFSHGSA